jgi:hypothetical protein
MKGAMEIAGAASDMKKTRMTIAQAHGKLGHCNEDATRKAAKQMGWELKPRMLKSCEACAAAKAKQKNVPQVSEGTRAEDGKNRIYLDIAMVKQRKGMPRATKPNWRIVVNQRTGLKFSNFFNTKNGMVKPTCEQIHRRKQNGITVNYIRLDNAGEKKLLKQRCQSKDWKFDIKFEFTPRATPQQNALAELGFATLANRGCAMMLAANLRKMIRYKVHSEAFKTATLLDGLMPVEINSITKTRYEHWTDKGNPAFAKHLSTWDEAGTVTLKSKVMPKVKDHGVQCMFVGYALDHLGDTYRMWNPLTGGIHESCDIIWLHRMYYSKPSKPGKEIAPIRFSVIDDDDNELEPIPIQEAEEGEIIKNEPYQAVHESDSDDKDDTESDSEDEEPNVITT